MTPRIGGIVDPMSRSRYIVHKPVLGAFVGNNHDAERFGIGNILWWREVIGSADDGESRTTIG